jgi:biopolymer transport protein ExbD
MKFRHKQTEELELNLTPLIDVVFLLLIFFMVSTTFQKESEISLQLPKSTDEPVETSPEKYEIVVNASGRYFINDTELVNTDIETLRQALFDLTNGQRDIPITIRADAQTPHQSVVTAMDAAAQLGLSRLSIATSHSP